MTLAATATHEAQTAHLRARIGGYVVDMVIFAAITMVMTVLAGFILLASIDWGTQDPTDPQLYTFLAIIGIGTPLIWTLLNVALLADARSNGWASMSLGCGSSARTATRSAHERRVRLVVLLQSAALQLADGVHRRPATGDRVVSLISSSLTIVVFGVVVTLCIACPIIALVSAAIDRNNRALHDRVAGVIAVPSE